MKSHGAINNVKAENRLLEAFCLFWEPSAHLEQIRVPVIEEQTGIFVSGKREPCQKLKRDTF